jgi:hypothetical protein
MTNASDVPIFTAAELLAAEAAPRHHILAPLLDSESVALLYGPPGIGKSLFALAVSWAAASGGSFLGWTSPRPHRVMHVDGGLSAAALCERLALFGPTPDSLRLCPLDLAAGPAPDLSAEDGLLRLMDAWDEAPELLVVDAPAARPDSERWDALRRFARYQRRQRRAVLLVHYANKEGGLSGGIRRALDADLVIALRPPDGRAAVGNARFVVHVEKTRRRPAAMPPVLVELETDPAGRAQWCWSPADATKADRVARLLGQGLGARQAAAALGVSRSALYRLRAEAKEKGLLP